MQRQELIEALSISMTNTMLRSLGSVAQTVGISVKEEVAIRSVLSSIQKEVLGMMDGVSDDSLSLMVESAKIQEKLVDRQEVVELSFKIGDRIFSMLSGLFDD